MTLQNAWIRQFRNEVSPWCNTLDYQKSSGSRQTIQERIVAMMQHTGLSDGFWAEVLLTAVHIINMSPSRPLKPQISQDIWTGIKLRIFGCKAYALIPKDYRLKLALSSRKYIFLGYGHDGEIGYRLYPEHRQIVQSSDIVSNELAMHQSATNLIEVLRLIFSSVPTLHEGPTHNTRSASQVAKPSNINSTLPNDSALNHQTLTPVRPVQSYLEDKRDCCSLRRDTLPDSSLWRQVNRQHMKKHRHVPIWPPNIFQSSPKWTPFRQTRRGTWSNYRKINMLFHASRSIESKRRPIRPPRNSRLD